MLLVSLRFGDQPTIYGVLAPIRFFGYISYGFYLFHNLGFLAFDRFMEFLGVHPQTVTISFVLFRFVGVAPVSLFSAICPEGILRVTFCVSKSAWHLTRLDPDGARKKRKLRWNRLVDNYIY
ncbi:MAG: acyltransferase [Edaphobacter sp.]|nr:acyltransferase [Edaphobacter sp.]